MRTQIAHLKTRLRHHSTPVFRRPQSSRLFSAMARSLYRVFGPEGILTAAGCFRTGRYSSFIKPITRTLPKPNPFVFLFKTFSSSSSSSSSSSPPVAIFWDLDNKPPNSIPPFDAAFRLRLAASSLGPVKISVAYANRHALTHVPAAFLALRNRRRRSLERLESGDTSNLPFLCRVCGRNFYRHSSLLNHFKTIHQTEQAKRLNRLHSARGSRRVHLAAKLSLKMDKYKKAAGEILIPEVGYGLADELKRANFYVRVVDDSPDSADRALGEHMVDVMDKGRIGCLVLVSDDTGFCGVVREARLRCLRTVVVGDEGDGALRRCADAGFSWKEVISGKARKEAGSAVGKWTDRDLLKRLEWKYRPEEEESGWDELDGDGDGECLGDSEPWWKLDENVEGSLARSSKL